MTTSITDGTTTATPIHTLGYESSRPVRNVEHPIVGSPSVGITLRRAGLRTGTLEFLFPNAAEALACEQMLAQAKVFTYVEDEQGTLGMTFVTSGQITATLDDETQEYWVVSTGFTEVAL